MEERKHEWLGAAIGATVAIAAIWVLFRKSTAPTQAATPDQQLVIPPMSFPVSPPNPAPGGMPAPSVSAPVPPIPLPPTAPTRYDDQSGYQTGYPSISPTVANWTRLVAATSSGTAPRTA